MPSCPRCNQSISVNALSCSHCGLELKAHGHPGIELHRASGETYLCDSCSYHQDNSCTFPQRPQAKSCTLYQDASTAQEPLLTPAETYTIPWWRQYSSWILMGMLVFISIALAIL